MVRQFRTISYGDLRSPVKPNLHLMALKPLPGNELGYSPSVAFPMDHIHVLVNYPPQIQLSKLVNSLKGVSSRILRQRMPAIASLYYKDVLWSPSYFATSCGGAPLSVIKQYVEQQNRPL